MEKQIWKPRIQQSIDLIRGDPEGWEKCLELYDPTSRPKKRGQRFEGFTGLGLGTKWKVDNEIFSPGWFGFDQMMINITTPGFKKAGVAVKKDKLEYLERLWLFSTKDEDQKILADKERLREYKAQEQAKNSAKWSVRIFLSVLIVTALLLLKSCIEPAADSEFMKNCQYIAMKSHAQCKRTEKINRQTEKRLNEYFGAD